MNRATLSKIGRFLLGFLGWFLYANLMLFLWSESMDSDVLLFMLIWIPTIAMTIALYARRKAWLATGLVGAMLVNTAIWVIGSGGVLEHSPGMVLLPWPLVIGLLILN